MRVGCRKISLIRPVRLVTIGQNLEWPRGRISLARKNPDRTYNYRFSSIDNVNVIMHYDVKIYV